MSTVLGLEQFPIHTHDPTILGSLLAYITRVISVDILLLVNIRVNNNNMVQLGEYVQIISPIIYGAR
jgi:hypothetical protein